MRAFALLLSLALLVGCDASPSSAPSEAGAQAAAPAPALAPEEAVRFRLSGVTLQLPAAALRSREAPEPAAAPVRHAAPRELSPPPLTKDGQPAERALIQ